MNDIISLVAIFAPLFSKTLPVRELWCYLHGDESDEVGQRIDDFLSRYILLPAKNRHKALARFPFSFVVIKKGIACA